ncbi:hypothetical protein PspLS_08050 [Pyricularia sp. CBS 133598]|nr:hypothetical protein PspLS_08050 [Pyricularia sp. CBS 133598]
MAHINCPKPFIGRWDGEQRGACRWPAPSPMETNCHPPKVQPCNLHYGMPGTYLLMYLHAEPGGWVGWHVMGYL